MVLGVTRGRRCKFGHANQYYRDTHYTNAEIYGPEPKTCLSTISLAYMTQKPIPKTCLSTISLASMTQRPILKTCFHTPTLPSTDSVGAIQNACLSRPIENDAFSPESHYTFPPSIRRKIPSAP